jgi:hypothetical protein
MYCTNCGASLSTGTQTCPACGAATSAGTGSSRPDMTLPVSSPISFPAVGPSSSEATLLASSRPESTPATVYGENATAAPVSSTGQQPGPFTPPPAAAGASDPYSVPPPPPPTPFPANQQSGGQPYYPAPQAPGSPTQPRRRFPAWLIALVALLAIVLIAGGGGLIYYAAIYQPHQQQVQATATAQAHATATAHTQATAAVENPYTHSGTLVFTDPLTANNQGHRWDENSNCAFKDGTYHAIAPDPHYSDYCIANATDFSNFAYQVNMTVLKGDGGGMLFHVENTNPNEYYEFDVAQDGTYGLYKADAGQFITMTSGSNPAIHQGLNQTNVMGVVVQGSKITLYVNSQPIDTVTDSTFSHGQIGVSASVYNQVTEASFTNLKVWKL